MRTLFNRLWVLALCVLALSCSNPVAHLPVFPTTGVVPPGTLALGGSQYKLIPYDQISVKFTYHPEHDSKIPIPIQPDGNITLDGVGTVQAAGLTPAELGKSIAEKTSNRLRDPEVVVTITQYAPRKVYVGGQVNTPGVVLIQDGMTPLQAIFDRGGFTSTAQIDSVVIIRDAGSEKQKIGRIDLSQPLENATPESMTLSANDVVYVPMTGIGRADLWVKQHLRDIVPSELLGIGSMGAGFR